MRLIRTVVFPLFLCAFTARASLPSGQLEEWRSIARPETLDVFLKDRLVGTLVHSLAIVDSIEGLRVESSMSVRGAPGAGMSINLFEQRLYDADGTLRTAFQRLIGESGTNEWKLTKSAKGWLLTVTAGGIASAASVPSVRENLSPTLKIYKSIQSLRCRKGDVFRDTVFELVSQKNVATTYRCTAVTRDRKRWTFEVIDDIAGRSQTWELDADARTLSQEIEGVFVARKRDNVPSKAPRAVSVALSELADIFSVKKDRAPAKGEQISVTFSDGLSPDSTVAALYRKKAGRWILSDLVRQCGPAATGADTAFSGSAWTRPTVTIQSDFPAIVSLAHRLAAGRKDQCAIIDTCNRFVFLSLAKRNSATFSSAVETLKAGYGDCGEHAVLLAAILRAAGIPARVVLGLLYYKPMKAFVGHAWVMAHAAGTWSYWDPAFGIVVSARDRVPLIIDDNGAHALLLTKYIGRIGIEYRTGR